MIMPYTLGELFTQVMNTKANSSAIPDVQIDGSSIVNNGVASIPYAGLDFGGVVKIANNNGIAIDNSNKRLYITLASTDQMKAGTHQYRPIVPYNQHESIFFGLSKLAGVDLASETVTVGTYPAASKSAIQSLIGIGLANTTTPGLAFAGGMGVSTNANSGEIFISAASSANIKAGTSNYQPIVCSNQHEAVFYGLAKAAGDATQSASANAVGTYTDGAKTAIKSMLGVETVTTVSGSTPTITGVANTRYICGEVSTISITPPQSGIIDVRFDSGSTATTLTVPNTVKWPGWFDPTDLDTNCTYEINIMDGIYGSVMVWA